MTLSEKQMEIILNALADKIENLELWQQIQEKEREVDEWKNS